MLGPGSVSKDRVRERQTPTHGGSSSQITLKRPFDEEPTTVSYNTKVFNKEIQALREEEETLLKYQNAARMREYKVDKLKY